MRDHRVIDHLTTAIFRLFRLCLPQRPDFGAWQNARSGVYIYQGLTQSHTMASASTESPAAVPEPAFSLSNATVSNPSSEDELSVEDRPKKRPRHLCSLGTGT